MESLVYVLILCLVLCFVYIVREKTSYAKETERLNIRFSELKIIENELREQKELLQGEIENTRSRLKQTEGSKKSTEIRTGMLVEHWVPVKEDFPYDRKKAHFLGNPIDYIVFEEEEIIFLEVKTGKSRLNKSQKRIKDLIDRGKIRFEEMRFS
jgi:predicted Holliday junction resolvase-like endonuclease